MSETTETDSNTESKRMTFEGAYARLEDVCDRLAAGELKLEETLELLREGHGLEKALRGRLDSFQQELEEIEAGQGLVQIEIVADES